MTTILIKTQPGPMQKVAIIGSRTFPDRRDQVQLIMFELMRGDVCEVVTGTWPVRRSTEKWGVDEWAVIFALAEGIPLTVFDPDDEPYAMPFGQRCALRNRKIAERADFGIALWDGESPGTKMTIEFFKALGKEVEIIGPR